MGRTSFWGSVQGCYTQWYTFGPGNVREILDTVGTVSQLIFRKVRYIM